MSLSYELDITGIIEASKAASAALERHIPVALKLGADIVAAQARKVHDYTDRTSELTNSIMPGPVSGSLAQGLDVTVAAGAPYSLFVEEDTDPHPIRPRHRKKLRFPVEGGFAFADEVQHPGTTGTHFLSNAAEARISDVERSLEDAAGLAFEEAGFGGD